MPDAIRYIDSHTGGEPTRVIVSGGPDLGQGSLATRATRFGTEFDHLRSCYVMEPRGSDVLVGALLQEPVNPQATCGVIFFNNAGILGMCGHGTIGLVETLTYLKRISPGRHLIETPVGDIVATLAEDHRVRVQNVPSYRYLAGVKLEIPGLGLITGDVAYGGNWFFLVCDHGQRLELPQLAKLRDITTQIRQELIRLGITGPNGEMVDHIELSGEPHHSHNHSRNFVLCPGMEYDRSPCGTGTSAKLACLAASGKLQPGAIWRQESIIGSVFEGSYQLAEAGTIIPTIVGRAWVTADGVLLRAEDDPFRDGIRL